MEEGGGRKEGGREERREKRGRERGREAAMSHLTVQQST